MIIAIGSRKASPGVTTFTTMLAAYWKESAVTRLILEADASGGTIAARWKQAHDLTWDPGLVAMSANRGRLDTAAVHGVSQRLADDFHIAAAPPSPHQVAAALGAMGEKAAASLAAAPDLRVFADCGRLSVLSPSLPLARRAALTILLCRPNLEEVHTLLPGVAELRDAGCALGLVAVGDGPYHPGEVAENAQVELLGHLPDDLQAAGAWSTDGLVAGRRARRSMLARTVSDLAVLIADRCAHTIAPDVLARHPEHGAEPAVAAQRVAEAEPVGFAALVNATTNPTPAPALNSPVLNGASSNGVGRD